MSMILDYIQLVMYFYTPETSMSVVHFQFLQFFLFCVIHIGITPFVVVVVVNGGVVVAVGAFVAIGWLTIELC